MSFFFTSVSSWLTAFISFDRLVSIGFEIKFRCLESMNRKLWYTFGIYLYNFIVYLFYIIDFNLFTYVNIGFDNKSETFVYCLPSEKGYEAIKIIFIANNVVIPFLIMLCCSVILIRHIQKVKTNALTLNLNEKKKSDNDFRFWVTILSMNCLFFVFNTPFLITMILELFPELNIGFYVYTLISDILFEIYYLQYVCNLFIYLAVYSRFRKVFIYLLLKLNFNFLFYLNLYSNKFKNHH